LTEVDDRGSVLVQIVDATDDVIVSADMLPSEGEALIRVFTEETGKDNERVAFTLTARQWREWSAHIDLMIQHRAPRKPGWVAEYVGDSKCSGSCS
jgi:hypothetical protein